MLALLPFAGAAPAPALVIGAVLVVALLAWGWTITSTSSARAVALLATADPAGRIGTWELFLLAFAAVACALYIAVGAQIVQIAYNDGAYYYGVARHMAQTGRFEEPIVWHFLHPPDRLLHAPFDYWGCTTSLILAAPLALFGASTRVAFVTMSLISCAALLAFWYLVCRALPLRYHATQLLAVALFALSPAMRIYRWQPESIAISQLFMLLALIAFCRRRTVLAVLCGFALLLTRGDGLILFGLIAAACFIQEGTVAERRRQRIVRLGLVLAACLATYSLWSFVSFGTPTPPAPRLLPFLTRYMRVFDYVPAEQRILEPLSSRFTSRYLVAQLDLAFTTLRAIPFTPALDAWLVLALVPALVLWQRSLPQLLIWWLVLSYFVMAWVAGPGFARPRTPFQFTPVVVLAGALGVDVILSRLDAWTQRRTSRIGPIVTGAAVLACCALLLLPLPLPSVPIHIPNYPDNLLLPALDDLMQGEPVATNVPWYMIAHTRSPAVAIPHNGEAAIAAVLDRYQIRWIVIPNRPGSGGYSRALLDSILSGQRTQIGRFRLERVAVQSPRLAVFRVHPAT